uniref:Large ribosomal subunit protein uL23c n=1 Tax=Lepidodinium chlorophorum TaxID=107758 RepID=A0A0F7QZM5_LEPCH|nr:ribosomal protein L23 [Lepidodinium chlorophorum]BAR72296.1 ribosomal protein L23 [Lepidodinium chlorophorum]
MIIIKRLVFTEKATKLLEQHNKYTFEVGCYLTKIQICWLVEKMFNVPVLNVNTFRLPLIINQIKNFYRIRRKRAVVYLEKKRNIQMTLSRNESVLFWVYKSRYSLYYIQCF